MATTTARRKTKKKTTKKAGKTTSKTATVVPKKITVDKKEKFKFIDEIHELLQEAATTTRSGEVKLKRKDVKDILEYTFNKGVRYATAGYPVKFPVIGTLRRKDVPARKAKKGVNPFTGEPMTIKARPASKKPAWRFPKAVRETFMTKRFW
jgi:nucleoid DNA-binding protein